MKLYIGGAWQGQTELALRDNPNAMIWEDFHESVRQAVQDGIEPQVFAEGICRKYPDAVIISNEVGSGVVPLSAQERAFREAVGRALCVIAQEACEVTRVSCGIGVRIK